MSYLKKYKIKLDPVLESRLGKYLYNIINKFIIVIQKKNGQNLLMLKINIYVMKKLLIFYLECYYMIMYYIYII